MTHRALCSLDFGCIPARLFAGAPLKLERFNYLPFLSSLAKRRCEEIAELKDRRQAPREREKNRTFFLRLFHSSGIVLSSLFSACITERLNAQVRKRKNKKLDGRKRKKEDNVITFYLRRRHDILMSHYSEYITVAKYLLFASQMRNKLYT